MSFLISTAHAAPAAAQGPSLMANLLMIAVFIGIFYFLIWRPQAKRAKEHRSLIESLGVGSEIVFAGGLMGKSPNLMVTLQSLNSAVVSM
jgi:preprotein translocase subunit YajC